MVFGVSPLARKSSEAHQAWFVVRFVLEGRSARTFENSNSTGFISFLFLCVWQCFVIQLAILT